MRAWIGKYLAGVGIIHGIFGLILFRAAFAELLRDGLLNSVYRQPERAFAFWFVAIGLFWILLGAVIDHDERQGRPLPRFLGWSLAALALAGAAINTKSGWWLFFIPALAVLLRPPAGQGNRAAFDPDRMAALEVGLWKAYYRKQKPRLFLLLIASVQEQFRLPAPAAARCAWRLARAASLFGAIRDDYDRVLPQLAEGFQLIRDGLAAGFDPRAMARAELNWWVARRAPGENSPENVGRLIAQALSLLYGISVERVRDAGLLRARAAALRDQDGAQAPWGEIEALLKDSYRALRTELTVS